MPGCNFSYSHCSCLFNGLWKKNPLYSCSQTINRVLFDMNNCKTWMWDETYLEESVLERTFLPVYQVPLVLVLFLILCWYKKKEKIISRHWTMHGSTWFDGSLWQSGQCLVIAADLLHCIYIYIYEIKQEPLISSLFLIIYLSHPRHVDLIMKIECFFLSTTDSLYSHWIFFVLKWSGKGFVLQKFCTVNCNLKFFL